MSIGNHWHGHNLLCCFSPVHHCDEYVKLQDMHSKTNLLVSSSMHLILNKQHNKFFTKRHPCQPFDCLIHQGSYTKTHNIYDSRHTGSPKVCSMIKSNVIHCLRHSYLGVCLRQLLITLVTVSLHQHIIIQEQMILNTPVQWVRQPELGRNSIRIETCNNQSCTACIIHSQYTKQVCEIWSTIQTKEYNLQMSENKVNFKMELRIFEGHQNWIKLLIKKTYTVLPMLWSVRTMNISITWKK